MPTLAEFLQQHLAEHHLPAELGSVVSTIVQACQTISGQVRQGALAGVLGEAGSSNVQDEAQKKLDVIANQILIDSLSANPAVAGLASEEEEQFVSANDQGRYLVLFDPLDGSSNIDINISVGTIFSILEKPTGPLSTQSFLQSGRAQVASGYALYGPQTQLVLCLRHGVAVFTLDAGGQFVQTQLNPQIPQATREFAINMSNQRHWQPPMQQYQPAPLAAAHAAIYCRTARRGNRPPRQKLQYALGSQHGGRDSPHSHARRHLYVSQRRARPGQARQTAPDV